MAPATRRRKSIDHGGRARRTLARGGKMLKGRIQAVDENCRHLARQHQPEKEKARKRTPTQKAPTPGQKVIADTGTSPGLLRKRMTGPTNRSDCFGVGATGFEPATS